MNNKESKFGLCKDCKKNEAQVHGLCSECCDCCQDQDPPMGVSAWMVHGKKYKYLDFFKSQLEKEISRYGCGKHKRLLKKLEEL